jgi:hypothetical protein
MARRLMRRVDPADTTRRLNYLLADLKNDLGHTDAGDVLAIDWSIEPANGFECRLRAKTLKRWMQEDAFVRTHRFRNGVNGRSLAADARAFIEAVLSE